MSVFNEVLEAIDKLEPEDPEALIDIVERRRTARRRAVIATDIEEARRDFQAGLCLSTTSKDLMREIFHESSPSSVGRVRPGSQKNRQEKSASSSKHRGRSRNVGQ
jgi:hypothetical protein